MRVCIIGKYPPIEGGVSATTYWLAYGLAERGHEVSVVTNANEVEDEYRIHFMPGDEEHYAPVFPASGGRVDVRETEGVSLRMAHIPRHNPFVTKLAGLATETIRRRRIDAMLAYYFEPYSMAAYLASTWTGVPWLVRHAGSDLDRLMLNPQMSTAYKEALRAAAGVVTRRGLSHRFIGMGIKPERIFGAKPYAPPPTSFNPDGGPLAVDDCSPVMAPSSSNGGFQPFNRKRPTIGIYGKVGETKGSVDLLHALALLKREGHDFNFLAMTQGRGWAMVEGLIAQLGLDDRTWVLPFQPNWRIPPFIRTCTALCFLERDFPIKIHTPIVAQEVFATGGCLVLSQEIADKQAQRNQMIDGENVFLVADPKKHTELAAPLRKVITDPTSAKRIGRAGNRSLASSATQFAEYVESWEQLLFRASGHDSSARSYFELSASAIEVRPLSDDVQTLVPWLDVVLQAEARRLIDKFAATTALAATGDRIATGLRFLEFLRAELASDTVAGDKALVEECVRYQWHRWTAGRDEDAREQGHFSAADRLLGAPVSGRRARSLRPLRSEHAAVVEFKYDLSTLFAMAAPTIPAPARGEERTIVCFLRTPNLHRTEIKINRIVQRLIALCDGTRTTELVIDHFLKQPGAAELNGSVEAKAVVAALQRLYDLRAVIFCGGPASL